MTRSTDIDALRLRAETAEALLADGIAEWEATRATLAKAALATRNLRALLIAAEARIVDLEAEVAKFAPKSKT